MGSCMNIFTASKTKVWVFLMSDLYCYFYLSVSVCALVVVGGPAHYNQGMSHRSVHQSEADREELLAYTVLPELFIKCDLKQKPEEAD